MVESVGVIVTRTVTETYLEPALIGTVVEEHQTPGASAAVLLVELQALLDDVRHDSDLDLADELVEEVV